MDKRAPANRELHIAEAREEIARRDTREAASTAYSELVGAIIAYRRAHVDIIAGRKADTVVACENFQRAIDRYGDAVRADERARILSAAWDGPDPRKAELLDHIQSLASQVISSPSSTASARLAQQILHSVRSLTRP